MNKRKIKLTAEQEGDYVKRYNAKAAAHNEENKRAKLVAAKKAKPHKTKAEGKATPDSEIKQLRHMATQLGFTIKKGPTRYSGYALFDSDGCPQLGIDHTATPADIKEFLESHAGDLDVDEDDVEVGSEAAPVPSEESLRKSLRDHEGAAEIKKVLVPPVLTREQKRDLDGFYHLVYCSPAASIAYCYLRSEDEKAEYRTKVRAAQAKFEPDELRRDPELVLAAFAREMARQAKEFQDKPWLAANHKGPPKIDFQTALASRLEKRRVSGRLFKSVHEKLEKKGIETQYKGGRKSFNLLLPAELYRTIARIKTAERRPSLGDAAMRLLDEAIANPRDDIRTYEELPKMDTRDLLIRDMPNDMHAELSRIAQVDDRTKAAVVRRLLAEAIRTRRDRGELRDDI